MGIRDPWCVEVGSFLRPLEMAPSGVGRTECSSGHDEGETSATLVLLTPCGVKLPPRLVVFEFLRSRSHKVASTVMGVYTMASACELGIEGVMHRPCLAWEPMQHGVLTS